MAPLESSDGALQSVCRVVARLLHPEQAKPETDEMHQRLCKKLLSEEEAAKEVEKEAVERKEPVGCLVHFKDPKRVC